MTTLFEKIENILIAISRYFLIVFGALSLVAAVIILIYSLSLISDSPSIDKSKIQETSYSSIKEEIFPRAKNNQIRNNTLNNTTTNNEVTDQTKPVAKVYSELRALIAFHFDDSQDAKSFIANNITPRSISDYLTSNYQSRNFPYDEFLSNLVSLFTEIKDLKDYERVGDLNSRLELITETISLSYLDFLDKIAQKEEENAQAVIASAANNVKGTSYLTYVLFALAFYAGAVLYLMIFKVEIDLRRISPAIKDK